MTDLRTAAQQALEALETKGEHHPRVYRAIEALKAALKQPEQEPVAWCNCEPTLCDGVGRCRWQAMNYTHPPRREWRGLTEEEIATAAPDEPFDLDFAYARAIEQALKEKNQ